MISRRDFIKLSSAAGAATVLSGSGLAGTLNSFAGKQRLAIVGTGHRTMMWQQGLYKNYQDTTEVVGFCDSNEGRLKSYQNFAKERTGRTIPLYPASDFDRMIKETKPDTVMVTTIDGLHNIYIVRALELGCDVITEKPMTTDDKKCQQIIDAQKKYGKKVTVTFNYRYSPARTQVKELLMNGSIGDVLSVDFHWMLNTHHGADYFRRWHSYKSNSGGLMVHKATHHFDLVNWWLSAVPVSVFAKGKREFYTPEMAKRFSLSSSHERCHTCPEKDKCAFELDISKDKHLKDLYLDNEHFDNYFRDKCVFRPEIEIEDTMNVIVKYDNNVTMAYSLNAFNAWEGYYIVFNGTKGRLEHRMEEKLYSESNNGGKVKEGGTYTRLIPLRGAAKDLEVWQGIGDHAGGDAVMLEDIFAADKKQDKFMRAADQRAGAYSLLTGVAANHSMAEGKEIVIKDLVQNIGYPDYPKMPSHTEAVEMPPKFLG